MSVATAPGFAARQRNRAERTLFAMHFRRLATPLLLVNFGLLGLCMLIAYGFIYLRHLGSAEMTVFGTGLDYVAITLAVTMALPVGTAVFSRSFKEQQILFFHALPLDRRLQWLTLVGSSFAALLTSYALTCILRPGVIKLVFSDPRVALALTLTVAITFGAGACFALVFNRPIAVYLSAYIGTWMIATAATLMMAAPFGIFAGLKSNSAKEVMDPFATQFPTTVVVVLSVLCTLMYLGCSLSFYVRGEFMTMRTQLRNFGTVLALAFLLIFAVTPLMMNVAVAGEQLQPYSELLSPDARFSAGSLRAPGHPWRAKLRVIDLDSGKTTALIDTPGRIAYWWTDDGSLTVTLRDMSLLRSFRGNDHVAMYSPQGELLAEQRFHGQEIVDARGHSSSNAVIVTDDGTDGHVMEWKPSTGAREVASAPLDQPPFVMVGKEMVVFANSAARPRAWRVENGAVAELPWAKVAAQHISPFVIRGVVFPDQESAMRELERVVPLPRAPGDSVVYSIPTFYAAGGALPTIYALRVNITARKAALYVLPKNADAWQLVGDSIPMLIDDRFTKPVAAGDFGPAALVRIDPLARAVFVTTASGSPMLRLHDAESGRTIDVAPMRDVPRLSIGIFKRGARLSFINAFVRSQQDPTTGVGLARFIYDGELRPLPRVDGSLAARRPDGTLLFETNRSVVIVAPNGTRREVSISR